MKKDRGRWLPLSPPRRLVCDIVHFGRKVPSIPIHRRIDVRAIRAARGRLDPRPSWTAIFLKAYSLVAARHPQLRQTYLPFPWPRIYEYPENVAIVAVERQSQGEPGVFFGRVRSPDLKSLADIDRMLDWFQHSPPETINTFRESMRTSRYPLPIRRLLWWLGLNVSGRWRARRLGTFGLSVFSALGSDSLHPIAPITTVFTYDVIDPAGGTNLRMVFDHRVLDGAAAARILADVERELQCTLLDELTVRAAAA